MHINCPHCRNAIEVVAEKPIDTLTCPSCGSSFSLLDAGTATYRATPTGKIGRFELIEILGSGHFGDVWLAKDPVLDRFVAVKLPRKEELQPGDVELFLREARSAAQLKHPHIVSVHEVGMEGDRVYIVSDVVRGPNLADWMSGRELSPRQAAELCATLADAIHHAHEHGVIHRDLKPSNVLLDSEHVPHLTDFGLAKRDGGEITVTLDGKILGTPAYMSPEQARGDAHHADRRSDVYSLGVTLYELLTGARPFCGKSKMLMIHQVLHEEPRPPRRIKKSVPKDLETICLKAMSKEPPRRYQTAREMAEDLRRYLAGQPIVARPVGPAERTWRWVRHNRQLAACATVAILAIFGAGAAVLTPRDDGVFRRQVSIKADKPNARLAFIPLRATDGQPQPDRAATATMSGPNPVGVRLPPGEYLVVSWVGDRDSTTEFHEVYRYVPGPDEADGKGGFNHLQWEISKDGAVEWADVHLHATSTVTAEMAEIPGSERFRMGSDELPGVPPHIRRVPGFLLDATEVTYRQAARANWPFPPRASAESPAGYPITYASYDYAVGLAERLGKRLMEEAEYEVAATRAGALDVPWGGDVSVIQEWEIGDVASVAFDVIRYDRDVFGLYSNAAEWTGSWGMNYPKFALISGPFAARETRVIRGGSIGAISHPQFPKTVAGEKAALVATWRKGPRMREYVTVPTAAPELGFRCARSRKPRLEKADFISIVDE